MKKIYFFIMAMFLAVMPLVFVSCSDDEEKIADALEEALKDDESKEAILNVKLVSEGENEVKYVRVYLYKNLTGEPTTENNQYEAATNDEGIVKFEFDKDDFTTEVTMTAVVFGEEKYYSAQTTLKIGETKTITITIP